MLNIGSRGSRHVGRQLEGEGVKQEQRHVGRTIKGAQHWQQELQAGRDRVLNGGSIRGSRRVGSPVKGEGDHFICTRGTCSTEDICRVAQHFPAEASGAMGEQCMQRDTLHFQQRMPNCVQRHQIRCGKGCRCTLVY